VKTGHWEGDYTDVEGHRARVQLIITETGPNVKGRFELILSTEDQAEHYQGSLSGSANDDNIVLRLHWHRGEPMVCALTLREPAAYAEEAVFGVCAAMPVLKLGGGVLIAWKFRRP
jgi:hypothetical protein